MEVHLLQNGKCGGEATLDLDFVSQSLFLFIFHLGLDPNSVLYFYNITYIQVWLQVL